MCAVNVPQMENVRTGPASVSIPVISAQQQTVAQRMTAQIQTRVPGTVVFGNVIRTAGLPNKTLTSNKTDVGMSAMTGSDHVPQTTNVSMAMCVVHAPRMGAVRRAKPSVSTPPTYEQRPRAVWVVSIQQGPTVSCATRPE